MKSTRKIRLLNDTGFQVGWFVGRVPPHALSATLVVKGTFRLAPGAAAEPAPPDEQELLSGDVHRDDDPTRSLRYASDFAMAKVAADLSLDGSCFAPGGKPAIASRVSFAVGQWSKSLTVVGDRVWQRRGLGQAASDPVPFASMPIAYEYAFGGAGFDENPSGRGVGVERLPGGEEVRRLPNIETPDRLVTDPKGKYPAAGFGPLPPSAPLRSTGLGTYDKKWLKEKWPWFPDDFDWRFFNAAPADQRVREFLRGDEPLVLENMHPLHARYESRLPGLRLRWFLSEILDGKSSFREIGLSLDTLHVDMARERVILVWRGAAPVRSKRLKEIEGHFVASEPLSGPTMPVDRYRAVYAERLATGKIGEADAKPFEPLPPVQIEPISTGWATALEQDEKDEDAAFEKTMSEGDERAESSKASLAAHGVKAPASPKRPSSPSVTSDADFFKFAKDAHAQLAGISPVMAALLSAPTEKEFSPEGPKGIPEGPAPSADAPPDRGPWTRDLVLTHAGKGGSFRGEDLSGLDLSGLALVKSDFEGAVLTGVQLKGTDLSGARLVGAVITDADLTEAKLEDSDLSGADLAGATLVGARLARALLEGADLSKSRSAGADLSGVRANEALFVEADLTKAKMTSGHFDLADFDGARLEGADITGGSLREASLEGVEAAQVRLDGADMTRAKAAAGNFRGAVLARIRGEGSVWEEASLDGADFSEALLAGANFESADLRRSTFARCDIRHGRFPDALMAGATMIGCNVFRGSLEGADLTGADLRHSNLFEAEFLDAETSGANLSGANLKGTKLAR